MRQSMARQFLASHCISGTDIVSFAYLNGEYNVLVFSVQTMVKVSQYDYCLHLSGISL